MEPSIKMCLAGGFLAGALIHDIRISRKLKKSALELVDANRNLHAQLEDAHSMIRYLVYKIDDGGVPWTEFDVIALTNPM